MRPLASLALLGAVVLWTAPAHPSGGPPDAPPSCSDAFSPDVARAVFERLRAPGGPGDCALDDVQTERSRMEIHWHPTGPTDAGPGDARVPLPAAVITPARCARAPLVAGETLALQAPAELAAACPRAMRVMTAAVRELHPPTQTASSASSYSRGASVASWIAVAVALLVALAAAVHGLGRGAGEG